MLYSQDQVDYQKTREYDLTLLLSSGTNCLSSTLKHCLFARFRGGFGVVINIYVVLFHCIYLAATF